MYFADEIVRCVYTGIANYHKITVVWKEKYRVICMIILHLIARYNSTLHLRLQYYLQFQFKFIHLYCYRSNQILKYLCFRLTNLARRVNTRVYKIRNYNITNCNFFV